MFGVLVVINPITVDARAHGPPRGGTRWRTLSCWPSSAPLAGDRCLQLVLLGLAIGTKQWALLARTARAVRRTGGGAAQDRSCRSGDRDHARRSAHPWPTGMTTAKRRIRSDSRRRSRTTAPGQRFRGQSTSSSLASTGRLTIHRLPGGLSREDISLIIPVVCTILVLAFAWRRRWRLTEEDAVALLADFLPVARHARQRRAPLLLRADGARARMVGGPSAWDSTRNSRGQCVHLAAVP